MKTDLLKKQLDESRRKIKTDSYSMSIGEIINLYEEGDINLNPAYQRLFRWDNYQRTNFLESILLGIPIPEIFVAQMHDAKWDIVDGVQRLSTILQFKGVLKGYEPLILKKAKYLTFLEDYTWKTLPVDITRSFRRSKLGVNIILTENSIDAQYDLFQRLNTGGLHLEDQEIRNCLLIMLDDVFYNKINRLKDYDSFKKTLPISREKFKKEYHMELILRYLIAKNNKVNYKKYKLSSQMFSEFIDKETKRLLEDQEFKIDEEIIIFKKTFDWLYDVLGEDVFKKFNTTKGTFEGAFLQSSFEAIATGVAMNIDRLASREQEEFIRMVKGIYIKDEYKKYMKRGKKALDRFKGLTELSIKYFSE
ncbi:MAG: DUF262 domain-containing protein [Candidatus Electrothrix sp. AX5]|nr:DUF262 domain-containing protein [Candidatus Electrothrix sp. AX5]